MCICAMCICCPIFFIKCSHKIIIINCVCNLRPGTGKLDNNVKSSSKIESLQRFLLIFNIHFFKCNRQAFLRIYIPSISTPLACV